MASQAGSQQDEGMMDIEAAIQALEAETAKEEQREAAAIEQPVPTQEADDSSTPAATDEHTAAQADAATPAADTAVEAEAAAAAEAPSTQKDEPAEPKALPKAQAPAASPKPLVADPFEVATAAAEQAPDQAEGPSPVAPPFAALQKPAVKAKKRQLTLGSVRKPAAGAAPSGAAATPDKTDEPASGAAAQDAADAPAKKKPAVARKKGLEVTGGVGKPASGGAAKPKTAAKPKAKGDKKEKKAKGDEKEDSAKPLRAKSAYQFFCAAERGNYKDLSMGEVSKKLGELWKGMGDGEKEPFEAKAKEDKERVAALKAEGGEAGQAGGSVGKENKAKKERKPTIKSAYMLFCDDKRAELKAANPETPFTEMAKLLGAAWKEATPDEKAKYQEQHAAAKQEAEANGTLPARKATAPKKPRAAKPAAAKKRKVEDDDDADGKSEADEGAEGESAADAADAAAQSEADSDDDEAERMNCDWEAHPAEYILAHTLTNKYLVKRKGCDYTEYGIVDAQAAKRQRLAPPAAAADGPAAAPACPVSLAQIDNYEAFQNSFKRARFEREDKHGALDLDELPGGSPLEMCYYLAAMQQEGQLLSKLVKTRGASNDAMIKVPAMGLSMVTQRVLEVERAARVAAEAHAAKLAAHNARLRAALPPGTDIPDEAEDEVVAASEDGDEAAADEPSSTAAAALVTSAQKTEPVPATAPEA